MTEISKAYDPSEVESKWYTQWMEGKAFAATADPAKDPFCIMIPPPNVTGILHMGHILNNTLQDIFVRRARLEDKAALWMPGTDHAGIATQARVEKELRKDGVTRHDLGREKFVEKVWEWREEYGGIILKQLREMGASCDWDRTAFTLDESYSRAVLTAFVKLYERGYIYRGKRLVNWCPGTRTALSNEEVNMKAQRGFLYKMRYELVEPATGPDGVERTHLEISTTRPETIMGDTGVAVHPEDERYKHLVGKMVWRPFPRAQIPVVADTAVDREFGTGVLKVTPAHDEVDFGIGQRHGLPILDVMTDDGHISDLGGEFAGMERFEARKVAANRLEELGLLVEREDYENNVGFSERADVPIEPRLKDQWWMRYPKVEAAKAVVEKGIIRFHPKRWEKVYLHWLEKGQDLGIDWCLSRQLWWGHRIPVWYRKGIERSQLDFANPEHVHVSVDGPNDPENWEQEEDVLDTWASSWLWPMATFGWPEMTDDQRRDLEFWYPTSVLCTGFDIIFLWVARMIIAGLELKGDDEKELSDEEMAQRIPFRDVYITGLIRDVKGRKLSKSLGNSPDPLDLINKFGADGLRFGIVNIAPSGQDILFSEQRIEIGRNFCNKLWNVCRFRQMSGSQGENQTLETIFARFEDGNPRDHDIWIFDRTIKITREVERCFATYEMHPLTHQLHNFFWGDFCDWYIEVAKTFLQDDTHMHRPYVLAVVDFVIRQTLMLLHPVMPFITEELWHSLGYSGETTFLQETKIPTADELEATLKSYGVAIAEDTVRRVDDSHELITAARALKAEYNVANKRDVTFFFQTEETKRKAVTQNAEEFCRLIGAEKMLFASSKPEGAPAAVTPLATLYLDLASAIDVDKETKRLTTEIEKLDKQIKVGEAKLNNEAFTSKAPAHIVEGAQKQLDETRAKRDELARLLESLAG